MELAISAVSGEILSRFVSFLIKKYTNRASLEEKIERLQQLLLRVHTVVEETEGRYITNSQMLVKLGLLVDAMYKGYSVLDTFKYKPFETTILKEQMPKRPYDTYLYIDSFMFSRLLIMFSRLVEKQQIIDLLLQDNSLHGAPAVVPVIGGYNVGKKSLVGYACNNSMKAGHETFLPVRTLVIVEFTSDVDDSEWVKFYSATSHRDIGSKVIIISRLEEIARFGTVKAIRLRNLSHAEFMYLFKILAFGGTDPENHPQMASTGMEIAKMLQGLLLSVNVLADILRKNQNVQFWLHILKRFRSSVEHNLSLFGEHPKQLVERDRPSDITMFISPSAAPLHLMPPRGDSNFHNKELSNVTFGDILQGSSTIVPKDEFQILAWQSRIPPFTKFIANCIVDKYRCTFPDNKKREWSGIK
ncbi:hypothetical protein C2845_PM01G46320 [Panicum miliaceum]|uniref:Disease resistance N-terminal domain-containing protein n=1 Tax=Panicum miliaceum TaxID=4540 RepID=A0A3L6TK33_PANMI|nr:hypothetical protein C2845_PM01G46320 [Panicum miliaceum]